MKSRWREGECLRRSPRFNPPWHGTVSVLVHASLCPLANDARSYWRTKVVRLPRETFKAVQGRMLPFESLLLKTQKISGQRCHIKPEMHSHNSHVCLCKTKTRVNSDHKPTAAMKRATHAAHITYRCFSAALIK